MSRVDELTDQLLEGKPFKGVTKYHLQCNEIMRLYRKAISNEETMSFKQAYLLKGKLRTAVIKLNYRPTSSGMNPKLVPIEHIRWALEHPIDETTFLNKEQRERIDSPIRAIRQKCLDCQGNDQVGVRECSSINCQLWPFRMGSNSFFGRLADSEQEITDEEIQKEEEEMENAD